MTKHNHPQKTQENTSETRDTETTECKRVEDPTVCDECGGDVIEPVDSTDRVCEDCGLVIDDAPIDHGPEWRSFQDSPGTSKSRVGPPTTKLRHDSGLATEISWRDTDAHGRTLSADKRQKMARLRKWDTRAKMGTGGERGMMYANGEIQRMGSALGVGNDTRQTAASLYQQAYENELIPGRSIEGVASAALYIALRVHNKPRSFDTIATVSRVERKPIARTKTYLCRELGINLKPTSPAQYLPQILTDLPTTDSFEQETRTLLDEVPEKELSGHNPIALAAAVVYAACITTGNFITQTKIRDASNTTTVSIRNNYYIFILHSPRYDITADELDTKTGVEISQKLNNTIQYID